MAQNDWVFDLENQLFALVKTRANKVLQSKYPKAFWTMDDVVSKDPTFPSIYVFFRLNENGQDLEGQDINSVYCMAQVEITVTKEQGLSVARYVSKVIMNEFKKLAFDVLELPYFSENTTDLKRIVFRCRRAIGQGDILNK